MKRVESFEFPGKFHEVDSYTGWAGANAATTEVGFQTSGKAAWTMEPTTRAFFLRQAYRDPLSTPSLARREGLRRGRRRQVEARHD